MIRILISIAALVLVLHWSGEPSFGADPCDDNAIPVANAGVSRTAQPGVPLTFNGSGSSDPDGQVAEYWWYFDDGDYTGWQPQATVQHAFAEAGTYEVMLWVRDNCQAMSPDDTVVVTVQEGAPPEDPPGPRVAAQSAGSASQTSEQDPPEPNDPCLGNQPPLADAGENRAAEVDEWLAFDGSASFDPDGNIVSWQWDFGDSYGAAGENAWHAYAEAGTYVVTLTVIDNCGESHSDQIQVAVDAPDPCTDNQSPIADAGNDCAGEVDESLAFNGSASFDPDGSIISYEWSFGDSHTASGQNVSHAYAEAGSYTVTLTVWDDCGESTSDYLTAEITAPGELHADFNAYELLSVDPVDGTEHWTLANLDNVEFGLRLKFDASPSTGDAAWTFWDFGDGAYGSESPEFHAFNQPNHYYTVTLTVYSSDWSEWDTISKTIHTDEGMQYLAMMPWFGEEAWPITSLVAGTNVWAILTNGQLGVADVSDPLSPGEMQFMPIEPGYGTSMALYGDLIYKADRASGVRIYHADPQTFELVGQISSSQLGGEAARVVCTLGNALYVGTWNSGEIFVFDLVTPASPTYVRTLALPSGLSDLASPGADYAIARSSNDNSVYVVDARDELDPVLRPPLYPPVEEEEDLQLGPKVSATVTTARAISTAGTELIKVWISDDPQPQVNAEFAGSTPEASNYTLLTHDRMYLVQGVYTRILKYDTTDPDQPYLMETFTLDCTGFSDAVLYDPDGEEGPESPVLLVGSTGYGYKVYSP